jgi:transcription termination factor Rho
MQRTVKGEVIASTFDRPAETTPVARLAIRRAKRLVELGHDVVVLLARLDRPPRPCVQPRRSGIRSHSVWRSTPRPSTRQSLFSVPLAISRDGGSLTISRPR